MLESAIWNMESGIDVISSRLDHHTFTCDQRLFLAELEQSTLKALPSVASMDSLTQSDREDEVTRWLELHRVR